MSLIACKECGKEISSKTKKCPSCGAFQKNWFMRHKILSFIGGFFLFIFLMAMFSDGESSNTTISSSDDMQVEDPIANIGDLITTEKFEITILSVEKRKQVGSSFFSSTPAEGGLYITVQWQYKNISSEPIGTFSVPYIRLIDENETRYSSDIGASGNFATELDLDRKILSDLNPGITVQDADVFEISEELYESGEWKIFINADDDIYVSIK